MSQILPENFVASAFRLGGHVAVVTGGASGLGAAMCAGLAQAGATIGVLDVDEPKAAAVADAIVREGGEAFALRCDVTDSACVRETVAEVVATAGRVDVLVNSAGMALLGPAEDLPEEHFDRVLEVNLKGTFLACQAFGRRMLEQGRGSIVNIASIGGFVAYPHAVAYLASKGGVIQLTRGLALEWIGRVRVNAIAPTRFETPLTTHPTLRATAASEFIHARFLREGLAQPHQIAGAVVFLASDASELVTGHTLPVDDGYLIA